MILAKSLRSYASDSAFVNTGEFFPIHNQTRLMSVHRCFSFRSKAYRDIGRSLRASCCTDRRLWNEVAPRGPGERGVHSAAPRAKVSVPQGRRSCQDARATRCALARRELLRASSTGDDRSTGLHPGDPLPAVLTGDRLRPESGYGRSSTLRSSASGTSPGCPPRLFVERRRVIASQGTGRAECSPGISGVFSDPAWVDPTGVESGDASLPKVMAALHAHRDRRGWAP